jgi:hypothetical protein
MAKLTHQTAALALAGIPNYAMIALPADSSCSSLGFILPGNVYITRLKKLFGIITQ